MFKICFFAPVTILNGVVDKVEGPNIIAELTSRNKTSIHLHLSTIPKWIFPCDIVEGTKFQIKTNDCKRTVRISCKER